MVAAELHANAPRRPDPDAGQRKSHHPPPGIILTRADEDRRTGVGNRRDLDLETGTGRTGQGSPLHLQKPPLRADHPFEGFRKTASAGFHAHPKVAQLYRSHLGPYASLAVQALLQPDLEAALAEGPEPLSAVRRAVALLEAAAAADPARLDAAHENRAAELRRVLLVVSGVAPFLSKFFRRHPRALLDLVEDELGTPRSLAEYRERLDAALGTAGAEEEADTLRRFKYAELARITVRDCCDELIPEARVSETLGELSYLAEVLLACAMQLAAAHMAADLGPPCWRGADGSEIRLGMTVLGLGKLGGEELNYSSDVDLIYVHESPPGASGELRGGPGDLSPEEYFTRLARRFGKLVGETRGEGFLYRIDLDLRPEGSQGTLVPSSNTLASYYDGWAATWEKAAFMKARPVAGDRELGWQIARAIDPMIYRTSMDFGGVDAIKEMKEKIERQKGLPEGSIDIKLGRGGIRDVEFVAQALQLIHGGRVPQIRGRSAPGALRALAEAGILEARVSEDLLDAYRFLRRVENRLQMEGERQTHVIPPGAEARERLAWTLGHRGEDARAALEARLDVERGRVRQVFDGLFSEDDSERILDLFTRSASRLLAVPSTRSMIENLARHFAREIASAADPERAMNNLDRFIRGVGSRSFYWGLLLDRPELVARLATLFGASRYLSTIFATHPQLIEPVFSDPSQLLLSRRELHEAYSAVREELDSPESGDDTELSLAALRLFQRRELVNVGLLDLAEKISASEAEGALSEVAEVCLEEALALATRQLIRTSPSAARGIEDGQFLVVGLGKLGSRELTYGSDLDVIFLFDVENADEHGILEAQVSFVRLSQKLGSALQTPTAEGVCYEVDARLRPSGNQGLLVSSLGSFERYHAEHAQVWERQALLRSRPVAGSEGLAQAFAARRAAILQSPLPEELTAEMHRIRQRMETELANETRGRWDLKTGRGGLLDVETVVQLRQLQHGAQHPELMEAAPIATQLERIGALGLLPTEQVAVLQEGWEFLKRLSSRLRIVENRSISDLSEERNDLESVGRTLGYTPSSRTGSVRPPLLDDYRRHTEAIRRVYLAVLGVAENGRLDFAK
jgi:glutamate-ammonia-ligase adenylyltransferase